jgi:hypothetical protein
MGQVVEWRAARSRSLSRRFDFALKGRGFTGCGKTQIRAML